MQTVTRFTRASARSRNDAEMKTPKCFTTFYFGLCVIVLRAMCLRIPKKSLPNCVATSHHHSIAKPHTFRCGLSSMCFDDDFVIGLTTMTMMLLLLSPISHFDCVHASFCDNLFYLYLIFGLFKRLIRFHAWCCCCCYCRFFSFFMWFSFPVLILCTCTRDGDRAIHRSKKKK